jgi:hypothetical protein
VLVQLTGVHEEGATLVDEGLKAGAVVVAGAWVGAGFTETCLTWGKKNQRASRLLLACCAVAGPEAAAVATA